MSTINKARIGIIGCGQLGLYLCDAAAKLGLHTCIVAESADSPAGFKADQVILAPLIDSDTIEELIEASDVISFEKEDIPNHVLQQLAAAQRQGRVKVHPDPETLFMLKDKGLQKTWLQQNGFPTLPGQFTCGPADAQRRAHQCGFPLVQKLRCGGYDGRGVQIINSAEQIDQLWLEPSVLEPKLESFTELAVIGMRDQHGTISCYPAMAMDFDHELNTLKQVLAPANIPDSLTERAEATVNRVLDAMQEVGVFAFEFFLTAEDELIINEISPRVHNSGHLTMDACTVSQYEQHIRAVAGLPLAPLGSLRPSAMVNILYENRIDEACPYRPVSYLRSEDSAAVHWYGKSTGRFGRKMGHITATADSISAAAWQASRALEGLPGKSGEYAA
ncbi:5-(carboxyamino)imidazole ribonucleotide synthase [Candidatus Litorirhabdus singularis]|uniref:5-(carboxyamino)imidazole ribonucleotide synthase n=1 Tax=Candidatus Litorirhabdus singularis TaxID=2518993 RepID=UPI00243028A1|nr:5-(carboxyamino)imidazole ribonucleotide synthase [Candidatus Litorirhabdus singularis]